MPGERNGQARSLGAKRAALPFAVFGLALTLACCGTTGSSMLDKVNIFSEKKTTAMTASDKSGATIADNNDVECPGVAVRQGAATLMIGKKPGEGEPTPLDLRYQGSILRTARECHVAAGVMTMKVGIEGRIITGPAGGPGNVDVPLRIAVVLDGVDPKPIMSKLVIVPVTVTSDIDRVIFTHVEQDVTFPMPVPAADIDAYVVYVGFDAQAAQEKKKPPVKRKPAGKQRTVAKPKQG